MGPQPGSDALLAEENLRAVPGDLRRSIGGAPRADGRHENGECAMKTEFSCVFRDTGEVRDGRRRRVGY